MCGKSRPATALAASLFWAVTMPQVIAAESAQEVVGMWTFVSSINEQNGRKSDTYGPGAAGVMVLEYGFPAGPRSGQVCCRGV